MTEWHDVIEAFADGESVEADALKRALAVAAGREHLVDVLLVRQLVGEQSVTRPAIAPPGARTPLRRWGWIAAAAALIVASVTGGYIAGRSATGASAVGRDAHAITAGPAPAPTRVIQLENGVDWSERGGGH